MLKKLKKLQNQMTELREENLTIVQWIIFSMATKLFSSSSFHRLRLFICDFENCRERLEVNLCNDSDTENESLKPWQSYEVIFFYQLKKLEEVAYSYKVSEAIYQLRKFRNVYLTDIRDKMEDS